MALILAASNTNITKVAKDILDAKVVAFPTETVYGLGANALNTQAVTQIFNLKKRPFFNPLIIHFSSLDDVLSYFSLSQTELKLAEVFWPGPLTLILKTLKTKASDISNVCKGNVNTLAVRVPSNNIAREIIKKAKVPIAAPSANIANHLSPTMAKHVKSSFSNTNLTIIDGGKSVLGLESTIIEVNNTNSVNILRYGTITPQDIFTKLNLNILNNHPKNINAPGQLKKHYSPNTPLRLNATECFGNEALLAFGKINSSFNKAKKILNLSPTSNLTEAAANLFSMLWELDLENYKEIAIMPIPNTEIGIAINERLKKAAAKNL